MILRIRTGDEDYYCKHMIIVNNVMVFLDLLKGQTQRLDIAKETIIVEPVSTTPLGR